MIFAMKNYIMILLMEYEGYQADDAAFTPMVETPEQGMEWYAIPHVFLQNRRGAHTSYMTYDIKDKALSLDRKNSSYYKSLRSADETSGRQGTDDWKFKLIHFDF